MSCNEDIRPEELEKLSKEFHAQSEPSLSSDPGLVELVFWELMYTYAPVGKMIRKLETRILMERLAEVNQ